MLNPADSRGPGYTISLHVATRIPKRGAALWVSGRSTAESGRRRLAEEKKEVDSRSRQLKNMSYSNQSRNRTMESTKRSGLVLYLVLTYLTFWVLLGVTGLLISLKVPDWVVTVMKNVCAWSPTFVVLMMFKRLYPGVSFGQYLKGQVSNTRVSLLLLLLAIQLAVVFAAIAVRSLLIAGNLSEVTFVAAGTLPLVFLINLTSGPLGEELGWRGFVLNELQKRHSPFAATMIVATVWGFWHTPLWFLSGYQGVRLAEYAILFLVGIFSVSVVMTVFYNRNKSILIPIWIHLLFNFLLQLFAVEAIALIVSAALGYLLFAIVLTVYDRKNLFGGILSVTR